jgi:integrase
MSKRTGPKISPHVRGGFYTTLTVRGSKKFIYGQTEEEVLEKYIEARYMHNQGYNVTDNPSMKDYAARWFNIYKKGRGAIKTREMYINAIEVHIVPALGKKRVKDVTASDVQELLNSVNSSQSLQHKVRITLNQIFKKAQADRLVEFNPVAGTDPVDAPPPVRLCYSPEQRAILIDVLQNHKVFPLAFAVLNSGMRVTEAIALMRRRDLDLESNKIYVRESTEFEKYRPQKKETKTKRGVREIPIPSSFAAWLTGHMEKKKSLYVFPGHHGGQMGQTELKNMQRRANEKLQRWFGKAEAVQEKAAARENLSEAESDLLCWIKRLCGDSPIGEHRCKLLFKTLRHTYCTELYDLGVDEVSAAAIMGHSVSVMREIYTHIQKERKIQTEIKIEQLYSGKIIELPKRNDAGKPG